MSGKKLPKAIRSTIDQMREAALLRDAGERPGVPAPVWESGRAGDVIEVIPRPVPAPITTALVPVAAPPQSDMYAARRRLLAGRIVERHAAYSAVGGVIPIPIANVASITAIIVRMVKRLSGLYGVPFERDRARAIVVGLLGGATPMGLATVTSSTLVYVIPGANLVGLAVSSVAGSACTRGIGKVFVEHFESGATLTDFPTIDGR